MLTVLSALAITTSAVTPAPTPPRAISPAIPSRGVIAEAEVVCSTDHCDETAVSRPVGTAGAAAPASTPVQPQQVCVFLPDPTFSPPLSMPPSDKHQGEAGTWLRKVCTSAAEAEDGKARDSTVGEIVWSPSNTPPSAASLAQAAYKQLKPPSPALVVSPPVSHPQIVGMPLWLSLPASSWVPVTSTASAGAASVTVTAKPVSVSWSMGDGGRVTCHGPGTPYPPDPSAHPPLSSPTCGYTYSRPSGDAPGRMFPVNATTDWQVAWSGSGTDGGPLPDLHTSAGTQVTVDEVQALVTGVSD